MTPSSWSATVNSKFYNFKKMPKENAVVNESISGRTVAYLKNTRNLFIYDCSLSLRIHNNELDTFWTWYFNMGGLAGCFTCPALGNSVYRFVSIPEPQTTSNVSVEMALKIEEVY